MMELKKEDWEKVETEATNAIRQALLMLAINKNVLEMAHKELKKYGSKDKPKP